MTGEYIPRIYFFCLAPTKYPANPERMAARHIGKSVEARLAAGTMSFTKAVKITPITSPMTPERIARNNETLFIVIAPMPFHEKKFFKLVCRIQSMPCLSIAAASS